MFLKLASALTAISVASAAISVRVGDGGRPVFNPNNLGLENGEVVTFQFVGSPGNHSVSQSSFDKPCEQLPGGFDSGFVSVPTNFSGPPPEWNLTITNSSEPIWFYCKQPKPILHCILGMVGGINVPVGGVDAFTRAAKALSNLPSQTPGAMTGIGAAATAAPSPLPGSTSGAPASSPSSKATSIVSNSLWTVLAAAMGIEIM